MNNYDMEANSRPELLITFQEYPKSDAGERYVILTLGAQKVVQTILQIRENGEYLFCENGKRIRSNGFRRKLMRVCKTVGVPYRSNHKITVTKTKIKR